MKLKKGKLLLKLLILIISFQLILPLNQLEAQMISTSFSLPTLGTVISLSDSYEPSRLKGIVVDVTNPLKLDFILDMGDQELDDLQLKSTSENLVKYFMSALTIPEDEMWVNLSPYEQDRIISDGFGQTEMGRDLLAQDYMLKQLTASLMHPEKELGEHFWTKVYDRAQEMYGHTDIPLDTFNKVWILPNKAQFYENEGKAYIVDRSLSVMLEEDYVAFEQDENLNRVGSFQEYEDTKDQTNLLAMKEIVREVIVPAIEQEVNEGTHFAKLR